VEVLEVVNHFYGEIVSVAGLLAGEDFLRHVPESVEGDLILVPAEALNQDDLFIDSMPLSRFREAVAPAHVLPALEITDALRNL
jgi:NifB/MoaA-like Fe-S oxidoreductase